MFVLKVSCANLTWAAKLLFLSTLGQHIQEEDSYKIKSELPIDSTLFVNIKQ